MIAFLKIAMDNSRCVNVRFSKDGHDYYAKWPHEYHTKLT